MVVCLSVCLPVCLPVCAGAETFMILGWTILGYFLRMWPECLWNHSNPSVDSRKFRSVLPYFLSHCSNYHSFDNDSITTWWRTNNLDLIDGMITLANWVGTNIPRPDSGEREGMLGPTMRSTTDQYQLTGYCYDHDERHTGIFDEIPSYLCKCQRNKLNWFASLLRVYIEYMVQLDTVWPIYHKSGDFPLYNKDGPFNSVFNCCRHCLCFHKVLTQCAFRIAEIIGKKWKQGNEGSGRGGGWRISVAPSLTFGRETLEASWRWRCAGGCGQHHLAAAAAVALRKCCCVSYWCGNVRTTNDVYDRATCIIFEGEKKRKKRRRRRTGRRMNGWEHQQDWIIQTNNETGGGGYGVGMNGRGWREGGRDACTTEINRKLDQNWIQERKNQKQRKW